MESHDPFPYNPDMDKHPHFMTFTNGPHATARVEFGDRSGKGMPVKITIEFCVEPNFWDLCLEDVQAILRLKADDTKVKIGPCELQ